MVAGERLWGMGEYAGSGWQDGRAEVVCGNWPARCRESWANNKRYGGVFLALGLSFWIVVCCWLRAERFFDGEVDMRLNVKSLLQMSVHWRLLWGSASAFINPEVHAGGSGDAVGHHRAARQHQGGQGARRQGVFVGDGDGEESAEGGIQGQGGQDRFVRGVREGSWVVGAQKRIFQEERATDGVMFIGKFNRGEENENGPAKEAKGFLQIGGQWEITIAGQ